MQILPLPRLSYHGILSNPFAICTGPESQKLPHRGASCGLSSRSTRELSLHPVISGPIRGSLMDDGLPFLLHRDLSRPQVRNASVLPVCPCVQRKKGLRCIDRRHRYPALAWELYYWIVLSSTPLERIGYSAWFVTDLIHAALVIRYAYAGRTRQAAQRMCRGVCISLFGLWVVSVFNPDHQNSAFWTGLVLQMLISWGSLYDLVCGEGVKGHSLEIWFVKPHKSNIGK